MFYVKKVLLFVIWIALLIIVYLYTFTRIYQFPTVAPFSGPYFYNPYQNMGKEVIKANFHAHASAWGGLTNGGDSDKEIVDAYQQKGYAIAGVSNYHSIHTVDEKNTNGYVPIYEHGYNLMKWHCLALQPKKVSYIDFPLFQSISHQQTVIEQVKGTGAKVVLAHPHLRGRSLLAMQQLVGYTFMEVLSPFCVSDQEWDAALGQGKLSWIMANDDIHSLQDEKAFHFWNVVFSNSVNKDSILVQMERGCHYGVLVKRSKCTNSLASCIVRNDSLIATFTDTVMHLDVRGEGGKLLAYRYMSKEIAYKIQPEDRYMRLWAKNIESDIYTNPIIRWDGKNLPLASTLHPKLNLPKTGMVICFLYILLLEILGVGRPLFRRNLTQSPSTLSPL